METEHEVAAIYARQAVRATRAAVTVVIGGSIATVIMAVKVAWEPRQGLDVFLLLATLGIGAALTAALYAWVSSLQTRAEIGVARHLGGR